MSLAPDFWKSKQTWNGLLAVANTIATAVFNKPEWLPYIALVHGALAAIFARDATAKNTEAIKEQTAAMPQVIDAQPMELMPKHQSESPDREVMLTLIEALARSQPTPEIERVLVKARGEPADSGALPSIFTPVGSDETSEVRVP